MIFMTYWLWIVSRFGVQKSISQSYYCHEIKALWWAWIIGFSLPVMIIASTPLMFVAGSAICFVGVSPDFRRKVEDVVHVAASYIGIILAIVSLWVDFGLWYMFVIAAIGIGAMRLFKIKNLTWWVETFAFVIVFVGMLIIRL